MLQKIRQLILRPPFAEPQDLRGRHFLVTGASEGSLGYATAHQLLRWGAHVTVTCRKDPLPLMKKLAQTVPGCSPDQLSGYSLDLADAESTAKFANWYLETGKPLDVLINNAGIHLDLLSKWTEPKLSDDGFEIQWRTNYLGTAHLTHLLLPLLLKSAETSGDARIVNVVSMLHDKGANDEFFNPIKPYNSWNAYGQSKLGLVHLTKQYQSLYGDKGLKAFCLHPGAVFTNVAGKGLSGNPFVENVRNAFAPIEAFFLMTPEEGAQTQVMCATAQGLAGGQYYRDCKPADAAPDAADSKTAEALWQQTEKWLEAVS